MTTEDDFQAALDANPYDWQTRLVFADWLQERNDPRAEGYRALGVLRRVPEPEGWGFMWNSDTRNCVDWEAMHVLPEDWYRFVTGYFDGELEFTFDTQTREEKEDIAARAFLMLPPQRRADILNTTVPHHV